MRLLKCFTNGCLLTCSLYSFVEAYKFLNLRGKNERHYLAVCPYGNRKCVHEPYEI